MIAELGLAALWLAAALAVLQLVAGALAVRQDVASGEAGAEASIADLTRPATIVQTARGVHGQCRRSALVSTLRGDESCEVVGGVRSTRAARASARVRAPPPLPINACARSEEPMRRVREGGRPRSVRASAFRWGQNCGGVPAAERVSWDCIRTAFPVLLD